MLGSTPITSVLGAAPPADSDTARLKSFAKAATAAGLALLLISPGSKLPVDVRTSQQRSKEDKLAQEVAKLAGRMDYMKAKSLAGAHLATTDPVLICRYIDNYRKPANFGPDAPINFAIEVGRSGLVVVDADTPEQVAAFMEQAHAPAGTPPTVMTPGQVGLDGEMAHKDGGHYYFTVDNAEDPAQQAGLNEEGTGSYTAPGGWVAMWRNRYVLIPPSVRPEGPYLLAGREYPLPAWLGNTVLERSRKRKDHAAAMASGEVGELTQGVNAWAGTISWAEILAPFGWTITARPDKCGCDIWTAPGEHGSPKSATTHDTGCELGRYSEENAPMHIWTDNPGEEFEAWMQQSGSKTLTKLQTLAITTYKGKLSKAMDALGLFPAPSTIEGVDPNAAVKEAGIDVDAAAEDITLPDAEVDLATDKKARAARLKAEGWEVLGETFIEQEWAQVTGAGSGRFTVRTTAINDDTITSVTDGVGPDWLMALSPQTNAIPAAQPAPEVPAAQPTPEPTAPEVTFADPVGPDAVPPISPPPPPPAGDSPFQSDGDGDEEPGPDDSIILISDDSQVPDIAPFDYWRDLPAPEYAIEGLIEHHALSCIIGPPGVGKSTVALDMACSLVTGQRWQGRRTIRQRVLYLPGEGLAGAVQRVKAWELAHGLNVGQDLLLGNAIIQLGATTEAWSTLASYVLKHRVGMIIFDTFARMSVGLEENSATEVGKAIKRFDQIRQLTKAGVLVVHHTGKVGTSGRGSSALNGALDTELLVTPASWDTAATQQVVPGEGADLYTSKQKNSGRLREPLPIYLAEMHDSVVVTGPAGVIGDPLDSSMVAPLRIPEPLVETTIRLHEYATRFPTQGVSRTELVTHVEPDDYTAARKDAPLRWKRTVAEAVDQGLRYGLLETLTGTASGMRYIISTTTVEQARMRAAQEAMTD